MFLSTPLAVMAMAILAEFKGSRWIAVLLSGDGEPYAAKRPGKVKDKDKDKGAEEGAAQKHSVWGRSSWLRRIRGRDVPPQT
jgi:hypothetical protein